MLRHWYFVKLVPNDNGFLWNHAILSHANSTLNRSSATGLGSGYPNQPEHQNSMDSMLEGNLKHINSSSWFKQIERITLTQTNHGKF